MVTDTARAAQRVRQVGERAAALAVTVEQSCLSGVGPDFDHRDPRGAVRQGWGAASSPPAASAPSPSGGKQFGEFRKAQFAGASVFKRVERGAADARFARERGLAELELFAALGDLLPDGGQGPALCLVY